MKITRKILENIIKEEIKSVLSEMSLSEQSKLQKAMDPLDLVGQAQEFGQRFASTQGERYKSRAEAQAALDKAAAAPGTASMKKDVARAHQAAARLRSEVQSLKTRVSKLEQKLGMDSGPV